MIRTFALLALLFSALPVAAQSAVHRCVGNDGRPVFSDQPCASVGATSVMPPTGNASAGAGAQGDTAPAASTGLLCAKDLTALRTALAQAFAARSANRVGGLILWEGSSRSAVDGIRSIEALVRQPLVSLEGNEATGIDAVTAAPAGDASTRRAHFPVAHDSGCLWLRPPG